MTNLTTTDVCDFLVLCRDLSNRNALQPARPVEAAEAAMDLIPIGMEPPNQINLDLIVCLIRALIELLARAH